MSDATLAVCNAVPTCPLCGGTMELVHDQPAMKVCMCVECHTGIHVPIKAWEAGLARATPSASRVVRPESDKATGQAPPEDVDGGAPDEGFGYR